MKCAKCAFLADCDGLGEELEICDEREEDAHRVIEDGLFEDDDAQESDDE